MKRAARDSARAVRTGGRQSTAIIASSAPIPLGEKLRAYLSTGAEGLGVSLEPSECQAVLNAVEHARQAGPITPSGTDTDAVTAFRRSLPMVAGCAVCSASTMGGQPPMACWKHALPVAVAERVRLKQQFDDVESLIHALVDTFGERKAVLGQVVMGLAVQVQAIRDDGGRP
ncbi:hypothetical protein [Corallococcus exiguus]|uniref:Uncharacterized protein n=1 Tax=Corallococcus exiguus TaxID=83462 RepID=A0A7X4Y8B8_9BACT|nr:hypothetical protein [Corallococcus exiguus]NBC40436.1 hypothetical protein [Corallococcus exiguus]TNV46814.1 hypothetical protein FH620_41960 [Corallococcus exiguus]